MGYFYEKYSTAVVKICAQFVSLVFWVFLQKYYSTFLHIKRALKYFGNLYVDP